MSVAGEVLKEILEMRYGRSLMAGAILVEAQEKEVGAQEHLLPAALLVVSSAQGRLHESCLLTHSYLSLQRVPMSEAVP